MPVVRSEQPVAVSFRQDEGSTSAGTNGVKARKARRNLGRHQPHPDLASGMAAHRPWGSPMRTSRPTLATTNAGRLPPVCPSPRPVACHRSAHSATENARCRRSATAATAWATALVTVCCQVTRGCASTSPCRGGRRASGCSCSGHGDSGTASYGEGKRAKRQRLASPLLARKTRSCATTDLT
jgi:hypothetical protein